jgi:hypothetical protein
MVSPGTMFLSVLLIIAYEAESFTRSIRQSNLTFTTDKGASVHVVFDPVLSSIESTSEALCDQIGCIEGAQAVADAVRVEFENDVNQRLEKNFAGFVASLKDETSEVNTSYSSANLISLRNKRMDTLALLDGFIPTIDATVDRTFDGYGLDCDFKKTLYEVHRLLDMQPQGGAVDRTLKATTKLVDASEYLFNEMCYDAAEAIAYHGTNSSFLSSLHLNAFIFDCYSGPSIDHSHVLSSSLCS